MEEIARDVTKRFTESDFAKRFGTVSDTVGDVSSKLHVKYSKFVTGLASSLAGHVHYQHLLSAREARDALEGHSDGSTLSNAFRVASSCLGSHLRVAAATLSP